MSINVEMTIFLCLICFFICAKMQGFAHECVFLGGFFLEFHTEIQDGRQIWRENNCQVASRLCRYPMGQIFHQNRYILHRSLDKSILHLTQKFKMAAKNDGKRFLGKLACRLSNYSVGQKFR